MKQQTIYVVTIYTDSCAFIAGACKTREMAEALCIKYENSLPDIFDIDNNNDVFDVLLNDNDNDIDLPQTTKTRIEEVIYYNNLNEIEDDN